MYACTPTPYIRWPRLQSYALKLHWSFRTFLKLRILSGTFAGAAVATWDEEISRCAVVPDSVGPTVDFVSEAFVREGTGPA